MPPPPLCFPAVFLNYPPSSRWPGTAPGRTEFCYQRGSPEISFQGLCILPSILTATVRRSTQTGSTRLRACSQHPGQADPEQGTRHYSPPEDLCVPLPVTPHPHQSDNGPDVRVESPLFTGYISGVTPVIWLLLLNVILNL